MRALILGARGQLGSRLRARLLAAGHEVVATTRTGAGAGHATFDPLQAGERDWAALGAFDVAINAIGAIEESRGATFARVHVDLARRLAAAHASLGAPRVLQVSALGARIGSPSRFLATKAEGDRLLVEALGARALVLRPSIVCTPGTRIVQKLARMARIARFTRGLLPVPPGLLECRVQPILAEDFERAVLAESSRDEDAGGVLELGGAEVFRVGDLAALALRARGLRLRPVRLSQAVWSAATTLCLPLISREELVLVREDNVLGAPGPPGTRTFVGASAADFFRLELSP